MAKRALQHHYRTEDSIASHTLKLILLGEGDSGKRELMNQLSKHDVPRRSKSFNAETVCNVRANQRDIKLRIHDTAGQERFRSITSSFYRGAHGCLLIFDTANPQSLQKLNEWHQEFLNYSYDPDFTLVTLVGVTKRNCLGRIEEEMMPCKGQLFADHLGIPFLEVSVDNEDSVKELFTNFATEILDKVKERRQSYSQLSNIQLTATVTVKTAKTITCSC